MIEFKNVSKYYKTKTGVTEGIRNVSVHFSLNEFVAITGESGSGKTTLLNVLSGFDSYEDGEIYLNGEETSHFTVKSGKTLELKISVLSSKVIILSTLYCLSKYYYRFRCRRLR